MQQPVRLGIACLIVFKLQRVTQSLRNVVSIATLPASDVAFKLQRNSLRMTASIASSRLLEFRVVAPAEKMRSPSNIINRLPRLQTPTVKYHNLLLRGS